MEGEQDQAIVQIKHKIQATFNQEIKHLMEQNRQVKHENKL